jgi:hypothetical protein
VGLAGRPGGPDFYISLLDNTHAHGPGGQGPDSKLRSMPAVADPCFGRVVGGLDVLGKVRRLPVREKNFHALVDYVEIVSMRIKGH